MAVPAAEVGTSTSGAGAAAVAQVVLTREAGKNGRLRKALEAAGLACLEMPLLETAPGPDRPALVDAVRQPAAYDWVCLTSPEAAKVFVEAWRAAGRPAGWRVAVVGEGTGRVLLAEEGEALAPQFTPSVANAEHFGPELPKVEGGSGRVLYPSSSKASTELQGGLTSRGFEVMRLNTYDTLPVTSLEPAVLEAAKAAPVLTIASPSAIKAWMQLSGGGGGGGQAIACIGGTSARAVQKLGLPEASIYYPQQPGVDNWAAVIKQALADRQ